MKSLRSPYPWFGGKSAIMPAVWARFGDVRNLIDPFAGSLASILTRPQPFVGTETVNDADGFIPNFWRAVQADPEAVAAHADWPVSELDLHARHLWLTNTGRGVVEQLREDPAFFDAKIAGWWVNGICQWIGSGWCEHPEWQQLPHLGDAGRGVHRPSQQLPHLGSAGMGGEPEIYEYFRLLSARLRRVRVCCGDWQRVCGPTPTVKQGLTAVSLDPPYLQTERDANIYAIESNVSAQCRAWCLERGNDKRIRIALCGYEGEGHDELERHGWNVLEWKARGGYGSQGNQSGREDVNDNAKRERIWFSPHCLNPDDDGLFSDLADAPAEKEKAT